MTGSVSRSMFIISIVLLCLAVAGSIAYLSVTHDRAASRSGTEREYDSIALQLSQKDFKSLFRGNGPGWRRVFLASHDRRSEVRLRLHPAQPDTLQISAEGTVINLFKLSGTGTLVSLALLEGTAFLGFPMRPHTPIEVSVNGVDWGRYMSEEKPVDQVRTGDDRFTVTLQTDTYALRRLRYDIAESGWSRVVQSFDVERTALYLAYCTIVFDYSPFESGSLVFECNREGKAMKPVCLLDDGFVRVGDIEGEMKKSASAAQDSSLLPEGMEGILAVRVHWDYLERMMGATPRGAGARLPFLLLRDWNFRAAYDRSLASLCENDELFEIITSAFDEYSKVIKWENQKTTVVIGEIRQAVTVIDRNRKFLREHRDASLSGLGQIELENLISKWKETRWNERVPIRHDVVNLLEHSTFENVATVSGTNVPGWEIRSRAGYNSMVRIVDTQFYEGRNSLEVTAPLVDSIILGQKLELESDTWYRLSGFIKVENVAFEGDSGGAYLNVRIGSEYHWGSRILTGSTGWERVQYEFVVIAPTTVDVIIGLDRASGTAWYDNIMLEKVYPKYFEDNSPGIVKKPAKKNVRWWGSPENIVANPDFEEGTFSRRSRPESWHITGYNLDFDAFGWDDRIRKKGRYSIRLSNTEPNDCMWYQVVTVQPLRNYRFSGWVKGENIRARDNNGSGAFLTIGRDGEWPFSMTSLTGTFDWRKIEFMFTTTAYDYSLTIQARLGIYGGTCSGSVWFDDIRIEEVK